MSNFKFKAGFTIIELLVVVSIIGILSSVVLTSMNSARAKSRDARRQSDVQQLKTALELYYNDNSSYPVGSWRISNNSVQWADLQTALLPYIKELPHDPKESSSGNPWSPNVYAYSIFSTGYGCTGQWYIIVYQLEVPKGIDPGVTSCDGTSHRYGGSGANTAIKTIGSGR